MTKDEQIWLNEYIRDEFRLDDASTGVSEEMRMAIAESFEFQRYLLKRNWTRLKEEVFISIRQILRF